MKLSVFLKYIRIFVPIIATLLTIFTSCSLQEQQPEEPQVTFYQIVLKDTVDALDNPVKRVKLIFNLIDGDGDMGLADSDTTEPYTGIYHYNCYVNLYEYIDGEAVEADIEAPFNFRIPDIEPQGQNKLLKAEVQLDMDFSTYNGQYLFDSILFDFFVYDKSLKKSNTASTSVIKLDTIGYFPEYLK